MNFSRLVASVGGYFLSPSDDAIAFHLYGGISATVALAGGQVAVRETSDYPWSGDIRIEVDPETPFRIRPEAPHSRLGAGATASVNGAPVDVEPDRDGYLDDPRRWQAGDVVDARPADAARAPLRPPRGSADLGRVALRAARWSIASRRPTIPVARSSGSSFPAPARCAPRPAPTSWAAPWRSPPTPSASTKPLDRQPLPPDPSDAPPRRSHRHPYYLWNNRGPHSMSVWIPEA